MKRAYTKYILALLLFGTNGIVASRIALSSYEIVLLRTMIGSLLLIALFLLNKGHFQFYRRKKDFLFLAISSMAMGISWMFLYEAYQQIGVSLSSLLYYCGPVIVMALSPLLFREKLTLPKIFGFALVLLGLVLVNGNIVGDTQSHWGILCGILSAVMYAFMVICNKKSGADHRYGKRHAAAYGQLSDCRGVRYGGERHSGRCHISRLALDPDAGACQHRNQLLFLFFLHQ